VKALHRDLTAALPSIYENGGGVIYDASICEGEVLLMPEHTVHAPQRLLSTAVESTPTAGIKKVFRWYCFECASKTQPTELAL